MTPRGFFNKDYRRDPEWRAIFGSSVDLTDCILNIQEIFAAKMATDADQPPDDVQHSILSECDVSSVDSFQTKFSSESDSGLFSDLDRSSVWRNSSSSNSSSHQSSPSLVNDVVDGTGNASHRSTSFSNSSKVHFVIDEIVMTERNYVKDLQEICEGYIQPMRLSCFFTSEDIDQVFGNIEAIWQLHSAFFAALLPPDLAGPAFIAHTFLEFMDQFEIYTDYCTNYPSSLKHLAHLISQHGQWFKERQQELHHPLALAPCLLKPIQRILKYHLLLQKLIDNCDADSDGYGTMIQALETMKSMSHNINDFLQQRERKMRFEQLQLLLVDLPVDLTVKDFGSLLLEDVFHVTSSKKERNLFLFEKGLLIVKPREDGTLIFKTYITHSNLMLSEVIPDNPLQFSVIPFDNPRLISVVESRNMDQKKIWTTKLKELILQHYGANIPAHVRDLVMQLGTAAQDHATVSPRRFRPFDMLSGPSAPEYLRRRRAKSPVRPNLPAAKPKLSVVPDPKSNPKSDSTKSAENRRGRKEERRSTKMIHVSSDYIPTTKEDEILFQERHSASRKSIDGTTNRKSSIEISKETLSTSNPDKINKSPPETPKKESRSSRYKTLFGVGTTFSKAYAQHVKPILKSMAGDQLLPVDKYPGSIDLLDGPEVIPTGSSPPHDFIPLMDETDDEDENVQLPAEAKNEVFCRTEHPKLCRLTYDHSDSISLEKNFCSSIKRKPVIKRPSSTSRVKSPVLIGEQEVILPKPLSLHIQDKIRALEERSKWSSDVFLPSDSEKKQDRSVLDSSAQLHDIGSDTWVSMMVKKIEAGVQP